MGTVILMTWSWWQFLDIGGRFSIWCFDSGCWLPKGPNRLPTSLSCYQHISTSTSVINIDVIFVTNIFEQPQISFHWESSIRIFQDIPKIISVGHFLPVISQSSFDLVLTSLRFFVTNTSLSNLLTCPIKLVNALKYSKTSSGRIQSQTLERILLGSILYKITKNAILWSFSILQDIETQGTLWRYFKVLPLPWFDFSTNHEEGHPFEPLNLNGLILACIVHAVAKLHEYLIGSNGCFRWRIETFPSRTEWLPQNAKNRYIIFLLDLFQNEPF